MGAEEVEIAIREREQEREWEENRKGSPFRSGTSGEKPIEEEAWAGESKAKIKCMQI